MADENKDLLKPEETGGKIGDSLKAGKGEEKSTNQKLAETIQSLVEKVHRLEQTADKKRLDQYDRLNQEDPVTIYKLRMIDGKVIIGWSDLITNKAEVNPVTRKIEEDQRLMVYYEDKTEEEMDLTIFNRRYQYIYTTLVEETKLTDPEKKKKFGNRIFKVKTDEGKIYRIGEKFIN